jgi:ABC-type glutathione transport system ATPase component
MQVCGFIRPALWHRAGLDTQTEPSGEILRQCIEEEGLLLVIDDLHACVPRSVSGSDASGRGMPPYVIAEGLCLQVEAGQSVLVMGPSGCGKSSLLRVIAGLWSQGSGRIACVAQKVLLHHAGPLVSY